MDIQIIIMYLNHDVQFIINYSIVVYLIYAYNKQNQPQNTHIIIIDKQQMRSMKLVAICEVFYLSPNSH